MSYYSAKYRTALEPYLGRALTLDDGVRSASAVRLPPSLRDFYETLGGFEVVAVAHHRLIPPMELRVENGWLSFMEENQQVVYWAVREADLSEDDPVIYQSADHGMEKWNCEQLRMSDWLVAMSYWLLTMVGQNHLFHAEDVENAVAPMTARFPLLIAHPTGGVQFFGCNGVLICVSGEDPLCSIWAGSWDEVALQKAIGGLAFAWS